MKKINRLYWISTALFSLVMLGSAIPDILIMPMAVQGMHDGLGYPVYLIPFLGWAKAFGVAAILLPVHSRIKEWAYTGLFIDLVGATYSMMAMGTPAANLLFMLLPFTPGVVSYLSFLKRKTKRQEKRATPGIMNSHVTPVAIS